MPSVSPLEALAEQSVIIDQERGICVATVAEQHLRDHLAAIVGNKLLEAAHRCNGRLIVKHDLVRDFSSAWINELLQLSTHCSGLGGHLVICGLPETGMTILQTTGLDKRLHIAETENLARETFALRSRDEGTTVLSWLFGAPPRKRSA